MKHIKLFEHYAENIVEGINYNHTRDADLTDVGFHFAPPHSNQSDEELAELGKEVLKKAKPVSLTGKIKEDAPKIIKYLVDTFKRAGIELDDRNVYITSSSMSFDNEIEIPVAKHEGLFFQAALDYYEIAANCGGKDFIIPGAFMTEDEGVLDYVVNNINDNSEIVKAANGLKKYLETLESEK